MSKNFHMNSSISLNSLYEKKIDFFELFYLSKFHNLCAQSPTMNFMVLNSSFLNLNFEKKRLPIRLGLFEILTWQKRFATKTQKNIFGWNLKKNAFNGLKLTLRRGQLYQMLQNINFYLPKLDFLLKISLKNFQWKKNSGFRLWFFSFHRFLALHNFQEEFLRKFELHWCFSSLLNEDKIFFFQALQIVTTFTKIHPKFLVLKLNENRQFFPIC